MKNISKKLLIFRRRGDIMGGRGAASGIKGGAKSLPNYKHAEIARNKLKNYLLNPSKSNGKAAFFNSLGYNMKNWRRFEQDIRDGLKDNAAIAIIPNKYGHAASAYNVNMPLGINKKAIVITGWQIDAGSKIPRFITAFPERR